MSGSSTSTIFNDGGWNKNGGDFKSTAFGTLDRLFNDWYSTSNVPSTTCPNETDRFSVSSSVAHLNYPVGLLTAEEIVMAGVGGSSVSNRTNIYIYTIFSSFNILK